MSPRPHSHVCQGISLPPAPSIAPGIPRSIRIDNQLLSASYSGQKKSAPDQTMVSEWLVSTKTAHTHLGFPLTFFAK